MPKTNIEREFVIDLPNCADQGGKRMGLAKFLLVEEFGDRTHDPLGRPFENQVSKDIRPLVTRKLGGDIQMSGAPVPPLRYDCVDARSGAAVPIAVRQQNPEFGGDARTKLILKRAGSKNLRKAPEADRAVGPDGENGVCS